MATRSPTTAEQKKHRRFEGVVVSDKMTKTCVVLVERWKMHPKYAKAYRVHRRFQVHDPQDAAHMGDTVVFEECRPISKNKRWQLVSRRPAATRRAAIA